MDLGIAGIFTDSFARLTGDEQKVMTTDAFDACQWTASQA
jgi:hypothetical protein